MNPLVVPSGRSIRFRSALARRRIAKWRGIAVALAWRAVRRFSLIRVLDLRLIRAGSSAHRLKGLAPAPGPSTTAEFPAATASARADLRSFRQCLVSPLQPAGGEGSSGRPTIEQHRQGR